MKGQLPYTTLVRPELIEHQPSDVYNDEHCVCITSQKTDTVQSCIATYIDEEHITLLLYQECELQMGKFHIDYVFYINAAVGMHM